MHGLRTLCLSALVSDTGAQLTPIFLKVLVAVAALALQSSPASRVQTGAVFCR